ncbi:FAD-binding oxidoreductase [Polymorphobacter sp.]|uniref:FAD-binding oxidoreductase n=1 Tax=Polymorphobacter sp. TaxID=1909290 RepID=UPI003F6F3B78
MADTDDRQLLAIEALVAVVGRDGVIEDAGEVEYFSQDYFRAGLPTLAVVRPQTTDQLARVIGAATGQGLAIFPRGGGYSYTDGYLPTRPGITLDLRGLDRIVEINATDMYVTVEPGCTWAALDIALAPLGLRTAFWGPFSGRNATVGGSISQGSISWGSARYGVSSETVLDLEIIVADGTRVRTGASGQPGHPPFFRNYGPDLTGIFCSDCGALGVKTAVTLRLISRPAHALGLSFGFASLEAGIEAASAVARLGVVSEALGMFAARAAAASGPPSLLADLKALGKIGRAAPGIVTGLKRMAQAAMAGRRFLEAADFTFHYIVEGLNEAMVAGQAEAVRQAVGGHGIEIANTVPTMLRADPFLAYDMLSPSGQRQLPPSTVLPHSQVMAFHRAFEAAVAPHRAAMAASNMTVTPVFSTIGTTGFLYEPVIAWDDAADAFHRRHSAAAVLAPAQHRPADPAARALAVTLRQLMIDIAFDHGGVHLQIGKLYPWLRERDAAAEQMLRDIKARVDPAGLMNPGALGL